MIMEPLRGLFIPVDIRMYSVPGNGPIAAPWKCSQCHGAGGWPMAHPGHFSARSNWNRAALVCGNISKHSISCNFFSGHSTPFSFLSPTPRRNVKGPLGAG